MHTHFFLGERSLVEWLSACEALQGLCYTKVGVNPALPIPSFASVAQLPDRGIARGGSALADSSYLVTIAGTIVNVEKRLLNDGTSRYEVYQNRNPDSVVLYPGGVHGASVQVSGHFSSISQAPVSKTLMARLRRELRKVARRREEFWIDEESLNRAREGWRLTTNVRIATTHDPHFE